MKRRSIALAVLLCTAGLGVLTAAAPAASAAPASCLVVDTNSDQSYAALQGAVTAAAPGDTLFVKGTCTGRAVITKNLTITGQSNGSNATATLNGGGDVDSMLIIQAGAVVTINNLIITGAATAGGIRNEFSTVTLNNSTVTGNTARLLPEKDGGGIYNYAGTVTLNNSTVSGNTAQSNGGGIYNEGGTVTLNGSTVTGNHANFYGGGISNHGTVTLNDSSVIGNTANGAAGIQNSNTVTLNGNSTITGNTAGTDGGGISNIGTVTLNDSSSITGNNPDNCIPLGSVPGCTG